MTWEGLETWFPAEFAEATLLDTGGFVVEVQAYWNFDNDPLFGDRASGTSINLLLPSENVPAELSQDDVAIRANHDRYRIRSLEPTCGDGLLTVLNVTRE